MFLRVSLLALLFSFLHFPTHAQTQQQLDSMERLIPKKSGKEKLQLLNDLTFYYHMSNTAKANEFGIEALALAKKIKDKKLLANTYNDASMPFFISGDYGKAVDYNKKALAIRKELKDTVGLVSSYSKLGVAYYEMAKYSEAQAANNAAIKYAKILKDEAALLRIYQNSANVLEESGAIKEALEIQKDIQALAKKYEDKDILITCLGNMASCYRKLKNFDKARGCYFEAAELIKITKDQQRMALVYQGLGVLEREAGNLQKGLEYYLKGYKVYKDIGSDIGAASLAGNIGNAYSTLGKFDSAAVYLKINLDGALKSKSFRHISNSYGHLAQNEVRRDNYKAAVKFYDLQNKYKDSVILFQGSKNQMEMFAKYKLEKKEREIAENKAELAEGKLKTLMATSISVALGILFLLVFVYFRRKRKQAKLELLKTKSEEKLLREKQLNEQKLEISRELHDNIGSQITYMISSMDNLMYVAEESEPIHSSIKNISEFGRETMKDLRSTIWAMNAEDGSLNVLINKLEDLRSRVPLNVEITNTVVGNPELKATEMLNLFRIVQEAIQNTLKYAEAKSIKLNISQDNQRLRFEISDDGKGFELKTASSGNGIMNMNYRSQQIGASLNMNSEIGKGTRISITLGHLSY